MANVPLSELFHVKGRFRRSVHLERDFYRDNAIDGYVLTATAREMLSRVISTLENGSSSKAWSLTGPYGSGKSAFALFAAKLLGNSNSPTAQQALELLERGDTSLYERFRNTFENGNQLSSGFCPILVSGERAPLPLVLLRSLDRGLSNCNGTNISISLQQELKELLETANKDSLPTASDVTHLYESATHEICDSGGSGLLLIIDELGKFLEFAAQNPSQGDMFVLQSLAELADRSQQTPLFLITILHQAFEAYAQRTAQSQREEWTKVQGRFEDVVFTEPTEQVLRLVGAAFEKPPDIMADVNCREIVRTAAEIGLIPHQLNADEFTVLLQDCLPLHPTVTLLIGPLFKRFAQNERSLFAFLNSSEPYGLQDFLSNRSYDGSILPMYSLPDLYDYLDATQGNELFTSNSGKKWAEIESAIMQLKNPSDLTLKLIKSIGLLGIVKEVIPKLKASQELLHYALDDNSSEFETEFSEVLLTLQKRSIITYRRHNDIYAIWEGSDVDIEERLSVAESRVNTKAALATDLSRYMPMRPLVARRHLHQTGTLRYFTIRYTDIENYNVDLNEPLEDADGLILYALPANEYEVTQLIEKATNIDLRERQEILIAIPRTIGYLNNAVTQLAYLHWVNENTPELESDAVARRELKKRLADVEHDVSERISAVYGADDKEVCIWYHKGEQTDIDSERKRNEYLSIICDEIFSETPLIRNELINRRKISGAATSARKKLIQAMLENENREDLGIEGYPPEMSIYRSLLLDTGIHRHVSGMWRFHPPKVDDRNKLNHTWNAIEKFLEKCEETRQPIENLFYHLMQPPLGIRNGPLPILLCAVILHYRTEIALYENGSYVADLSMPVFERLLKAPQQFEIKRFRLAGIRTEMFSRFLEMLNQPVETDQPDLLTIVAPLMRFISQLPNYTQKTQDLSDAARCIREVVNKASEPDELLFRQLPESLGFSAFTTEYSDSIALANFFNTLQDALSELGTAYDKLLNSLESMLAAAFRLEDTGENLRTELATRAEPLLEVVIDTQLKGFLIHLYSEGHDFKGWIESIGTFLAKKPPASWLDTDKAQFEVNLSQLVRKFRHFEAVSYHKLQHDESADETIRIGITTPNEHEQERVVILTDEEQAEKIEQAIAKVFKDFELDENPELGLAVLARISKKMMQETEK
ncbi:hypothetical protein F4X73_08805 [Candidatus Poribacteria bacterium]|nr:hypothetical protein [Candidatus Poribacteria bacterium]MYF55958.1 hypothetical protein [Candidatus Poribacteria bacterium]